MKSVEVTVYVKDDCHLCEDLMTQLAKLAQGATPQLFHTVVRNIEDNDAWFAEYREYVPVIVVNGQEVCHYFLDQEEFLAALSCP